MSAPAPDSGVMGQRPWADRAERWTVCLYLLFSMLTLSHFVHDHWYAMDPRPRAVITAAVKVPTPMDYAPNVYRVGAPFVAGMLNQLLPVHWSAVLATMDALFGFAGLFSLYRVLVDDLPEHRPAGYRMAVVLAFLAAVALPLNWVVPYQRPETMPSVCYLGLACCCLLRLRRGPRWIAGLLTLTLLQALTRSDVAASFGAAVLVLGLAGSLHAEVGARRTVLLTGGAALAVALGTQAYLQLVAFPHAVYPPGTPLYQLPYNLSAHNLHIFALATVPAAAVLLAGMLRRQRWRAMDVVAVAAAAIHLPVWYFAGSTAEVRIYVPFLLLLCVPAARIVAGAMAGAPTETERLQA